MADTNDNLTPPAPDVAADPAGAGAGAPDEGRAAPAAEGAEDETNQTESVSEPAKVLRIGSMVKTLLDEVRAAPLDEKSRVRLREIYEQSIRDLSQVLSPDLVAELERM